MRILFYGALAMAVLTGCMSTDNQEQKAKKASIEGQFSTVESLIWRGDNASALRILRELQESSPGERAEILVGYGCLGIGDFECAARGFKKASEYNKNNYENLLNYGYTLVLLKRLDEARTVFAKIEKSGKYPFMEKVYINTGLIYMEEKSWKSAIPYFEQALRLDPTLSPGHFNLGICYTNMNDHKRAVESFKKAVDFCSGCVDPELEYSKALFRSGQKDLARKRVSDLLRGQLNKADSERARRVLAVINR